MQEKSILLEDADITIEIIEKQLKQISRGIKQSNRITLTDINVICEEIFGKLLNELWDCDLKALTMEKEPNFAAVDLIDEEKRLAVQVTSRTDLGKIYQTVDKFVDKGLSKKVDTLKILVLTSDNQRHTITEYKKDNIRFCFDEGIIDFNKLIELIKEKEKLQTGFLVKIYDDVNMVFDSGRLTYESLLDLTNDFSASEKIEADIVGWKEGMGDIMFSAYIPRTYSQHLCCKINFRSKEVSGCEVVLGEEVLISDYFLDKETFCNRHCVLSNYEDRLWVTFGELTILLNSHTVFHLFTLFEKMKKEYDEYQCQIEDILGVREFERIDNGYLIMKLAETDHEKIIRFAKAHSCYDENGCEEWNVFNSVTANGGKIQIAPFVHGDTHGDIAAELSFERDEDSNLVNVMWLPGWKSDLNQMEGYDNKIKWKADYTQLFLSKMLAHIESNDRRPQKKIFLK